VTLGIIYVYDRNFINRYWFCINIGWVYSYWLIDKVYLSCASLHKRQNIFNIKHMKCWDKRGKWGSRDLSCPKGREEKPRFFHSIHTYIFSHLTALPRGKNLPIGQGARASGGRWYRQIIKLALSLVIFVLGLESKCGAYDILHHSFKFHSRQVRPLEWYQFGYLF